MGNGIPSLAEAQTAKAPTAPAAKTVAKPAWRDLSMRQQRALDPLASTWDDLIGAT